MEEEFVFVCLNVWRQSADDSLEYLLDIRIIPSERKDLDRSTDPIFF